MIRKNYPRSILTILIAIALFHHSVSAPLPQEQKRTLPIRIKWLFDHSVTTYTIHRFNHLAYIAGYSLACNLLLAKSKTIVFDFPFTLTAIPRILILAPNTNTTAQVLIPLTGIGCSLAVAYAWSKMPQRNTLAATLAHPLLLYQLCNITNYLPIQAFPSSWSYWLGHIKLPLAVARKGIIGACLYYFYKSA